MKLLYSKIKKYTYEDALKIEESDKQYKALQALEKTILDKDIFLALIIGNSIVCYQLSGTWEKYWEEFEQYFSNEKINFGNIVEKLIAFISNSKNNKRFIDTKIKRLLKLKSFLINFSWKGKIYSENFVLLRDEIAIELWQKNTAKTVVFSIKMFSYWIKIAFWNNYQYPEEIHIPIDSRITAIYDKYKEDYIDIDRFYIDLSRQMGIPMLLLDWILWVNYKELMW